MDYGKIQKAYQTPSGSIRFYARVAVANQDYLYLNSDGTTRTESITRDELFKPASTDSLKIQTITYPHPPEDVSPDNYGVYSVGSLGNTIVSGIDGDFLGVVGSITRRDAVDAFNSGVVEFSPGYNRSATLVKDSHYLQSDRAYNHLALVDRARGGSMCRANVDGGDDIVMFDPSQINESLLQSWQTTTGLNDAAIDRLLHFGILDVQPVDLTHYIKPNMTSIPMTIGGQSLLVDVSNVDTASKLAANYDSAFAKAAKVDQLVTDLAAAQATISLHKDQAIKAASENKALADGFTDKLAQALSDVAIARSECEMFAKAGRDTTAASACLDAHNLSAYKAAIVKIISPSFDSVKDADEIEARYKGMKDAFASPFFPTMTLENVGNSNSQANGSIEGAIIGVSNGNKSGLPSDADWM